MPEKRKKARQTSLDVGENTPTGRSSAENRQRSPISDLRTIDPGNLPVTSLLPDALQKNPVPFFLTVGVSNRDMYRNETARHPDPSLPSACTWGEISSRWSRSCRSRIWRQKRREPTSA